MIWDTGTYTVLPRITGSKRPPSQQTTDDDSDDEMNVGSSTNCTDARQENEKLIAAFQTRYIRLRLCGVRLPNNYTVTLRLPSANDFAKPHPNRRKSRQKRRTSTRPLDTDSEPDSDPQNRNEPADQPQDLDTDSEEDDQTRLNNAYPGSMNSIGSVHQRKWFMLLDRASSGFVQEKATGKWTNSGEEEGEGFEPFFVRGRDFERSVVTGRLANEVESDEGVEGFVGRNGWAGIMR